MCWTSPFLVWKNRFCWTEVESCCLQTPLNAVALWCCPLYRTWNKPLRVCCYYIHLPFPGVCGAVPRRFSDLLLWRTADETELYLSRVVLTLTWSNCMQSCISLCVLLDYTLFANKNSWPRKVVVITFKKHQRRITYPNKVCNSHFISLDRFLAMTAGDSLLPCDYHMTL